MFGAETVELINQKKIERQAIEDAIAVSRLSEYFTQETIISGISWQNKCQRDIDVRREVLDKWFTENFDRTLFDYYVRDITVVIFLKKPDQHEYILKK